MNKINLKFTLILSFLIIFLSKASAEELKQKEENLVTIITPQTFYEELKKHGKLFLYFYSKKCGACNEFNPIFEAVAKKSKQEGHNLKFVKIDGPENETFSDTFKLSHTPSIFYVEKIDGQLIRSIYKGRRSERAINRYLAKKHQYRSREIIKYDEFLNLVQKTKKFLIFFGDKETKADLLNKVVNTGLDFGIENIFWTKSKEFQEKYGISNEENDVIFHKNENGILDEGTRINLTELSKNGKKLTSKYLQHVISVYIKDPVNQFTNEGISDIDLGAYPIIITVVEGENDPNYDILFKEMQEVAKAYRTETHFFISTFGSREANSFTNQLNIKRKNLPAFLILIKEDEFTQEEGSKFLRFTDGNFKEGDFKNFYNDFKKGKLEKYTLSEEIPKNPIDKNGVYKLVGKTFNDVIINKAAGKHVILNICSKNKRCSLFKNRFARVVKKLKNNSNLFFAKIDIRNNDFEHVNIGMSPTVVFLFDGINRFENYKLYELENFTTRGIIKFIEDQIKTKDKTSKLIVENLSDDRENDEKEKYSPIKTKPEEENENDSNPEPNTDFPENVEESNSNANIETQDNLDLDKNDHVKEGL